MIIRKGASVLPCRKPAVISTNSVSPSGDRTFDRVILYAIIMAFTVTSGIPLALRISFIFPLCMLSKAFEYSINRNVAESLFACVS